MTSTHVYRPDIDGLRALAVLGVVLYHYGATRLPGGFTGVDVFFVISGYVITLTLRRQIEAGDFSIVRFYDSRLRRILPALLTMLAVTMVAGWFLLMPGDYAGLGESAAYAAFGLGNFYFAEKTGYFDQSADLLPFLHTWSLGVEEQFYVVWPIALFIALSLIKSRRLFLALLSATLALAFVYGATVTAWDPNSAFYFPAPRAWELATGAVLVFLPPIRSQLIGLLLDLVGIGLIAWSFLVISRQGSFPGINALYACLGAGALIWAKPATLISAALSCRPVVFVGLISYSLYLWHWPVLIFYRHYDNGRFPSAGDSIALFAFAVALAIGSWKFVEAPYRRGGAVGRPWVIATALAAAAIVAVPGTMIGASGGFQDRVPAEVKAMNSLDVMWQWDCERRYIEQLDGDYCVFGAPWDSAVSWGIVWGDSHAEHAAPLLEQTAKNADISFVLFRACPAALGGRIRRVWLEEPTYVSKCQQAQASAKHALQDVRFKTLVLASSWNSLARVVSSDEVKGTGAELVLTGLSDLVGEISRPGLSIILLDQMPTFSRDPAACRLASISGLIRKQCAGLPENGYQVSAVEQAKRFPGFDQLAEASGVRVVHPRVALCADGKCLTELEGEFLFRDAGHIRRNLSGPTLAKLSSMIGLDAVVRSP